MKNSKRQAKSNFPNDRKVLRKQKRQEKKKHRQEHYSKKKTSKESVEHTAGRFVRRLAEPLEETSVKKIIVRRQFCYIEDNDDDEKNLVTQNKNLINSGTRSKKPKTQPSLQEIINKERRKEKNEVQRLNSQMEEQRRKIFIKANEDEDKIIKKLEKQLGLNKTKNKKKYFADDGLDYLLEICDRTTSEQIVAAERHLAEVDKESDFEEDLAVVTGKEITKNKEKDSKKQKKDVKKNDRKSSDAGSDEEINSDNVEEDISDNEIDGEMSDDNIDGEMSDGDIDEEMSGDESEDEPEEQPTKSKKAKTLDKQEDNNKQDKPTKSKERIVSEENLSKVFSDDEISHLSGDDDDLEGFSGDEIGEDIVEEKKEKPDVWEDIYGRKRDKEGNVIKEEKGVYIPPHLRNKDSSSDKQLVQLQRQIKSVLNKLAGTNLHWAYTSIESLYSSNSRNSVNTALTELWLHATVAPSMSPDRLLAEHAALVAILHANVATEIGAHFLQELTERFDEMMRTPQPIGDKRLDNLVSCLAHLYSYKLCQANLLYDILSRLLEEITEKNIECVIVALRTVGGVLRKEEPMALKTFIHDTQSRVAKLSESAASGSRIKFLLEVLMAVKNNNLNKIPNYDPSYVEQLKKLIKGIIRKGNYITPLNVRLEDLLKAEERGKWWIVGSAWEGNRIIPEDKPTTKPLPTTDQKLLELARKQRMNTDVRRSVFCVIMSAEDYMDAFEKLQHLGLRGQQEREIVHVLMACCLQEKTYNPYYAVLAQKLCDTDRKYQLSIQFSVWDKIKELESLSKQVMSNLAQFLIHLIMEKGLPLSVLKIIQFSDLNKTTVKFMRQIILAIIMNADLQASLEVFQRISTSPKLHMFRESLKLFIQHFLVKNAGKSAILSDEEMAVLEQRTMEVDKMLTIHDSKLRF